MEEDCGGAAADPAGGMECVCLQQHKNNPARTHIGQAGVSAQLSPLTLYHSYVDNTNFVNLCAY